ncbi:MAG TPA: hypothetical protein IAB28_01385 [Candidatus Copromonas faecavium]|uniref:Uncharacterized protein n=1 Tax=Candidatus Copromonas faecavium (nom. illeg.) TaxID=2840740 RepID=A0A9D1A2J9_9FIRM|nr:hypothetical protein [Candidatus Copromonas faecavium]
MREIGNYREKRGASGRDQILLEGGGDFWERMDIWGRDRNSWEKRGASGRSRIFLEGAGDFWEEIGYFGEE